MSNILFNFANKRYIMTFDDITGAKVLQIMANNSTNDTNWGALAVDVLLAVAPVIIKHLGGSTK